MRVTCRRGRSLADSLHYRMAARAGFRLRPGATRGFSPPRAGRLRPARCAPRRAWFHRRAAVTRRRTCRAVLQHPRRAGPAWGLPGRYRGGRVGRSGEHLAGHRDRHSGELLGRRPDQGHAQLLVAAAGGYRDGTADRPVGGPVVKPAAQRQLRGQVGPGDEVAVRLLAQHLGVGAQPGQDRRAQPGEPAGQLNRPGHLAVGVQPVVGPRGRGQAGGQQPGRSLPSSVPAPPRSTASA